MRGILRRLSLTAILIALAGAPGPVAAEDSAAVQQLLESADYWQQRGRTDKLVEIWHKILLADPEHAEALAELARYYSATGQAAEAAEYLRRLEQAHPGHPALGAVEQTMRVERGDDGALQEARELVRQGQVEAAIPRYRAFFEGREPSGAIGIEFYQTLGGLEDGWDEAREGLDRIAAENPGNPRAALARATHLTYRESHRRAGIRQLSELAADPVVGERAVAAWRDALVWLNAAAPDVGLFRDYLAEVGEDGELRGRMEALGELAASRTEELDRLELGYEALEEQDAERAAAIFERALGRNGNNLEALVGLATVELQREDFTRARTLLERVEELAPRSPEKWRESLAAATFWEAVREGERLAAGGKVDEARVRLEEARALGHPDALYADIALGNLLLRMQRYGEAEGVLLDVVGRYPDDPAALAALVHLYLQIGRHEEAAETNARLAELDPEAALPPARIQAEMIRSRATFEREIGDMERAAALLAEALRLDPDNAWLRFELVTVSMELGDLQSARAALDELVALQPDEPEFRLTSARLYAAADDLEAALREMRSIPADLMTPEMRSEAQLLEARTTARKAVDRALLQGQPDAARQMLWQLEREVVGSPAALAALALAWSDLGDHERALSLARSASAQTLFEDSAIRLTLAAVLLRAGAHEELAELLVEIRDDPFLTPREESDLNDLRIAAAIARAEQLQAAGKRDQAMTAMAPVMREFPDDPRLINAVGWQLFHAGGFAEAEAVFREVLADDPDDVEARQGALICALELGNRARARSLLAEGLERLPDDPQMQLAAGRARAMLGQDARAVGHLRRALTLATDPDGATATTGTGGAGDGTLLAMREDGDRGERVVEEILRAAMDGGAVPGTERGSPQDAGLHREILLEIDRIDARHRARFDGGFHVRSRAGEGGLSQLTEMSLPVGLDLPTGHAGYFELDVQPMYVYGGELAASDVTVAERFGSYGAESLRTGDDAALSDFGVELRGGYRVRGYEFWVGSSPLGFPRMTVTGGLVLADRVDAFGFRLEGSRETVRDSMLSFAGVEDPVRGEVWGGVTANGGRLDLSVQRQPVLVYVFGGYHVLLGHHVRTNLRWQGGAGLKWAVHEGSAISLTTGVSGMAMGHRDNLRFFTYGHGGYFSPQLFLNAGVPVEFRARTGPFRAEIDAHVGVNWFREDEADYYPIDDDLQDLRGGVLDGEGQPVAAAYGARDELSFALDVGARLMYEITDHLEAGLDAQLHTAVEYTEFVGGVRIGAKLGKARKAPPIRRVPAPSPPSDAVADDR